VTITGAVSCTATFPLTNWRGTEATGAEGN